MHPTGAPSNVGGQNQLSIFDQHLAIAISETVPGRDVVAVDPGFSTSGTRPQSGDMKWFFFGGGDASSIQRS